MEKRISRVMLPALVVWLMPLIAWASNHHPAGAVFGKNYIITGGFCEVSPSDTRVDLTYDTRTRKWTCPDVDELEGGLRGPYSIEITLREITGIEPETPEESCIFAQGILAGGACWFQGGLGKSCTAVCQGEGMNYDTATATYAGSIPDGGKMYRCWRIARKFGAPRLVSVFNRGKIGELGCTRRYYSSAMWWNHGPTTADARRSGYKRYCACQR